MAKTLHIAVVDKVATYCQRDGDIVCGNNDYQISFAFDSEWDAYETKTARFIWGGQYRDVDITDNVCDVPIIYKTDHVRVGVYAGNLSTTTEARIGCLPSILCSDEPPTDADQEYVSSAKISAQIASEAAERAEIAVKLTATHVTPEMFGAIGDGITDDTDAIQNTLDSGAGLIIFGDKTYLIKKGSHGSTADHGGGGLFPKSNTTIIMSPKTVIKHEDSETGYYNIFNLLSVSNVSIIGGTIEGGRFTGESGTGEFGYGVIISDSKYINIDGVRFRNCCGDGIILQTYNTTDTANEHILIQNCIIHDCRRQGISLVNGQEVTIKGCHIYNINGTAPQSGIDFESGDVRENNTHLLSNILIEDCYIHDTASHSIILSKNTDSVTIRNCRFNGISGIEYNNCHLDSVVVDSYVSALAPSYMTIENSTIKQIRQTNGSVMVKNSKIELVQSNGGEILVDSCSLVGRNLDLVTDPKSRIESVIHLETLPGNTELPISAKFVNCYIRPPYDPYNTDVLNDFGTVKTQLLYLGVGEETKEDDETQQEITIRSAEINSVIFDNCNMVMAEGTVFSKNLLALKTILKDCYVEFSAPDKQKDFLHIGLPESSPDVSILLDGCHIKSLVHLYRFGTNASYAGKNASVEIKNCYLEKYYDLFQQYTKSYTTLVFHNNKTKEVSRATGITGPEAANVTLIDDTTPISKGGTGATSVSDARTNLGLNVGSIAVTLNASGCATVYKDISGINSNTIIFAQAFTESGSNVSVKTLDVLRDTAGTVEFIITTEGGADNANKKVIIAYMWINP